MNNDVQLGFCQARSSWYLVGLAIAFDTSCTQTSHSRVSLLQNSSNFFVCLTLFKVQMKYFVIIHSSRGSGFSHSASTFRFGFLGQRYVRISFLSWVAATNLLGFICLRRSFGCFQRQPDSSVVHVAGCIFNRRVAWLSAKLQLCFANRQTIDVGFSYGLADILFLDLPSATMKFPTSSGTRLASNFSSSSGTRLRVAFPAERGRCLRHFRRWSCNAPTLFSF